jgi:hypothetical protein
MARRARTTRLKSKVLVHGKKRQQQQQQGKFGEENEPRPLSTRGAGCCDENKHP